MKKISIIAASVALIAGISCAKEVKIGVILPMTGPIAAFGQTSNDGLKVAYAQNHTLKNGDTVKIIVLDDRGDKVEAATAARRLINKNKVTAILGEVASSNSMAIAPIAERSKTPMLTHASTNPRVTKGKKYVTRSCFIDPFQGAVQAKYALQKGYKTVFVVTDAKQDYSVGLSKAFKKAYLAGGGKIVGRAIINSGDKDFNAQVSAIKAKNPSIVSFTGYYPEGALLIRQARNIGVKVPFIGGDGVGFPELIKIGGKAANGFLYTDHYNEAAATSKVAKDFVAAFHKTYNKKSSTMGALAADGYMMILNAMNNCKDPADKVCVNKNIRGTKNFHGVTGTINIDKNGNAIKSAVINVVRDGKLAYETTVNP